MKELGMSKQTIYKNFKDLEELEMVTQTRTIGSAKIVVGGSRGRPDLF